MSDDGNFQKFDALSNGDHIGAESTPERPSNDSDPYDRVARWQRNFLMRHANGDTQYYADAASGLNIALQEIDHARWERERQAVWDEYQAAIRARENG